MFGRKRGDGDFHAEVESHIQLEAERLREQGMPEEEARAAARRIFGNVVKAQERFYEAGRWLWWEHLRQDVRYALRMLGKAPGFTATAVLTLGLGIGANTAIFSLIDTVMLRSLPVPHAEELMEVIRVTPKRGISPSYTYALWEQVRARQDVFTNAYAWGDDTFDLAQGGLVQPVNGLWVSGDFFAALEMRPETGRLLTQADDQPGCPAVVVLSYGFWRDRFGADPRAVGSSLLVEHHPFQVIGVAAANFSGLDVGKNFDLALPVCASAVFDGKERRLDHRSWWWLRIGGRVKPGLSEQQVNARLAVLSPAVFRGAVPTDWAPQGQREFMAARLTASFAATGVSALRRHFAKPLYVLMAIVGLVLLIACSNIASLTLARATARNKEIAVRQAMGASRWRLVRQLLTECLLLSGAGALLGILFAAEGTAVLVRYLSTARQHVFLDLTPDLRVLGFTAAVAVLTAILFGVLPALRATHIALAAVMKGPSDSEHRARFRPAKWIVASQVALSLLLLVVAGLLLGSFTRLMTLDLGFDRHNVLLVLASAKESHMAVEQRPAAYEEMEERFRTLPGVSSVSRSWTTPISGTTWNNFIVADSPHPPSGEDALAYFNYISPTYFETLRIGFQAGRPFTKLDSKDAPKVAIVNRILANRFYPGMDPIGRTFRADKQGRPDDVVQIVGVVNDTKYETLREDTPPTAFFPLSQLPGDASSESFELRTAVPPSGLNSAILAAAEGVNRSISVEIRSLSEQVNDSLVQERLLALLSGFFGVLALLLATIGLYGTLSYLVNQRHAEFGIRIALGAGSGMILRLVARDIVVVLAGGVAAGLCLALTTTRVLRQMLFGLGPRDTWTMIGAVTVLAGVAFLAGYFPARRATKVDPLAALRYD